MRGAYGTYSHIIYVAIILALKWISILITFSKEVYQLLGYLFTFQFFGIPIYTNLFKILYRLPLSIRTIVYMEYSDPIATPPVVVPGEDKVVLNIVFVGGVAKEVTVNSVVFTAKPVVSPA